MKALSDRDIVRDCLACGLPRPHLYLYEKCGCAIWKCASCGLGGADAASFDPAAFYTGDYFTGACSDGYADYPGAESVLRREFARTASFIAKQRAAGRLLDVGCAYGYFLQEARKYFEVAGIELAEEAAEHCRRAGLNVLSGTADKANMERLGTFDIITLLDVIEHLPAPHDTLSLCRRHLAPGGLLVLTTGDFASPLARIMGANWRLMTPPQHLWFFTRESLRRLSGSLGYTLESCSHPAKIVPGGLILFQLSRMLGVSRPMKPPGNGVGIPINLYDAMRVVLRRPAS
ncbi:MAG TPA: class I SAM-dependent methyltransferase [Xanthobacteraceae bacterium]|nr:class I SAM-dependent methyltransferase [Xanthobacteraceae bacterium]